MESYVESLDSQGFQHNLTFSADMKKEELALLKGR